LPALLHRPGRWGEEGERGRKKGKKKNFLNSSRPSCSWEGEKGKKKKKKKGREKASELGPGRQSLSHLNCRRGRGEREKEGSSNISRRKKKKKEDWLVHALVLPVSQGGGKKKKKKEGGKPNWAPGSHTLRLAGRPKQKVRAPPKAGTGKEKGGGAQVPLFFPGLRKKGGRKNPNHPPFFLPQEAPLSPFSSLFFPPGEGEKGEGGKSASLGPHCRRPAQGKKKKKGEKKKKGPSISFSSHFPLFGRGGRGEGEETGGRCPALLFSIQEGEWGGGGEKDPNRTSARNSVLSDRVQKGGKKKRKVPSSAKFSFPWGGDTGGVSSLLSPRVRGKEKKGKDKGKRGPDG